MSNERVVMEGIRAALARDPRLPHPAEVAVSARRGTVTVKGTIASLHQRHAAVQIAKSVRASVRWSTNLAWTRGIGGRTTRSVALPCRR
jgi:hypothetical protein